MIAERHARAAVNASTRQSSARSSDTVLCHVLNCCTRSALLHFANTSPSAAPVDGHDQTLDEEQPGDPPS